MKSFRRRRRRWRASSCHSDSSATEIMDFKVWMHKEKGDEGRKEGRKGFLSSPHPFNFSLLTAKTTTTTTWESVGRRRRRSTLPVEKRFGHFSRRQSNCCLWKIEKLRWLFLSILFRPPFDVRGGGGETGNCQVSISVSTFRFHFQVNVRFCLKRERSWGFLRGKLGETK